MLAVKTQESFNILLVNKMDIPVEFEIRIKGFIVKEAKMYLLDSSTYIQKFEQSLDKTTIQKSGIKTIELPKSNTQNIRFNGYSVAVLQAFPEGTN